MIAALAPLTASTDAPAGPILNIARLRLVGAIDWLRQTLCGLSGHAMMLHFESTRLSLHCASCGRTTPGWAIQASRSGAGVVRSAGAARGLTVVRP